MSKISKFIVSIITTFAAAGIGSIFTTQSITTWYVEINKPSFNPPNWIFGPVWSVLYLLMAIALYLVWTDKEKNKKIAYAFFFGQLILNTLWSIVFFGLESPLAAFLIIVPLWILILGTIITFYRISKPASYLLIPYILWVTFAAILNYSIFILN